MSSFTNTMTQETVNPFDKAALSSKPSRPVYVFKLPKVVNGIESIGLIELTVQEEMQAAKRSNGDPIRLAYEQVQQAVWEINGERVRLSDGTVDKAFDKMGPALRNMVMTAHARLQTPADGDLDAFLQSRQVRV
jgi:hypothetical protein